MWEAVSAEASAELWLVQTGTKPKEVKDVAGHSFLPGSSVTSGKAKVKVKLDSESAPSPASSLDSLAWQR